MAIQGIRQALAKPFVATAGLLRAPLPQDAEQSGRFTAWFSSARRDIMRAQRMRYRIFSEEYGASIKAPFGLDRDRFDKHCLHLMVRDNQTGELVGYTRVLTRAAAERTGGFYSASEFDLSMVERLPGQVAEIGRTCIHPDYRGGAVITVLWSRLARFMVENDIRYLIGCASVAFNEGYDLRAIISDVRARYLSPVGQRVMPLQPVPRLGTPTGPLPSEPTSVRLPPLLKAYLRMGARVCGEPCWDPDFNCLDFFILMAVDDLPARYVQHFLNPVARAV